MTCPVRTANKRYHSTPPWSAQSTAAFPQMLTSSINILKSNLFPKFYKTSLDFLSKQYGTFIYLTACLMAF